MTNKRYSQCGTCESDADECGMCISGGNWTGQPAVPVTADQHLRDAADIITERGKMRDQEDGERSFEKAAAIFNLMYPGTVQIDANIVIQTLMAVKLARASQGVFHGDDYIDLISYTALLLEEVSL